MRVSVVGLGKMGLPIAAYFAMRGADVTGIDIDTVAVASVNQGISTVVGEKGLDDAVADAVAQGTLKAATSFESVSESDVVVVLVPLLAPGGQPDFAAIDARLHR